MNNPIRIGLIGCGDIAVTRHLPALQASPQVSIAALCDADLDRASQLAVQYEVALATSDYTQLLDDPSIDAVVICTPPWVTPHLTIASLHAGKHVLCEKPMAVDLETAMKVREAEQSSGYQVQIGFTYRHGPLLETLRDWIRDDKLGSPLIYRLGIFDEVWDPQGNPEHYERISRTMERGSPSIHDGAHMADFLNFLTGSAVADVQSFGLRTRSEFPSSNYDVSVIRFENGDIAKVEIGWFMPRFPAGEFEVVGPRGIAIFDRTAQTVQLKSETTTQTVKLEEEYFESCFRIQLDKFIRSIRTGERFVPGTKEGIASLALTKAIEKSIQER
ncbi:Gfo/Idh/MocA family protein [Paenibacillus mendelii]|uniref:Gfo/Idh/MocA family protein n=1 Tax=Paenibacillus mendelii TaxID=206163 RepID=A0ABV6J4A6_9BACL|nr:Gfo/Idh/MocA family oxidoreductase [Paenibacillus mendelii]MCQ6561769.1 Gfo/Idh/MocA family oxidoreductase [Paenibacillus mendelii]